MYDPRVAGCLPTTAVGLEHSKVTTGQATQSHYSSLARVSTLTPAFTLNARNDESPQHQDGLTALHDTEAVHRGQHDGSPKIYAHRHVPACR